TLTLKRINAGADGNCCRTISSSRTSFHAGARCRQQDGLRKAAVSRMLIQQRKITALVIPVGKISILVPAFIVPRSSVSAHASMFFF
ncbi:MAG: hypothetical protein IPO59_13395, partial [Betaproteobacteria bacterium]|nr:hypothetical protein [Betaproteobacteria bacterium]